MFWCGSRKVRTAATRRLDDIGAEEIRVHTG
jgi:hypothetical protein